MIGETFSLLKLCGSETHKMAYITVFNRSGVLMHVAKLTFRARTKEIHPTKFTFLLPQHSPYLCIFLYVVKKDSIMH